MDEQDASYQRDGGILTIALGAEKAPGSKVKVAVHYQRQTPCGEKCALGWRFGLEQNCQMDNLGLPPQCRAKVVIYSGLVRIISAIKPTVCAFELTVPNTLSGCHQWRVATNYRRSHGNKRQYDWLLSVPASDYNIALNIGPFERIVQNYQGINGSSYPIEFWALKANADKARALIRDDVVHQLAVF